MGSFYCSGLVRHVMKRLYSNQPGESLMEFVGQFSWWCSCNLAASLRLSFAAARTGIFSQFTPVNRVGCCFVVATLPQNNYVKNPYIVSSLKEINIFSYCMYVAAEVPAFLRYRLNPSWVLLDHNRSHIMKHNLICIWACLGWLGCLEFMNLLQFL